MNENVKEKIQRYREGLQPVSPNRKFSRLTILISLLILAVMIFIYRRTPVNDKNFSDITLEYDNINYSITITRDLNTHKYILIVKLKSLEPTSKIFYYRNSIIEAVFKSEEEVIYRTEIGKNNNHLTLSPNEIKIFEENVNDSIIKNYIEHHPQAITSKSKAFLFNGTRYLPITALFKINTEKPISLLMDLKYEIE